MPINDAMFLVAERREQPMHVGGLELFELPPGANRDWLPNLYEEMISSTEISPVFQRRPHRSATALGTWSWQVDHDIDLEYHIRHSALPRPGRVRELLVLASRLHGIPLDRERPLWEAHLIEGLQGRRFAVYTKIHHALVDGVSALRLLEHSLTTDPDDMGVGMPWATQPPKRKPTASSGLADLLGIPGAAWRATTDIAGLGPKAGKAVVRTLLDQSSHLPSKAPKTILNGPINASRRFAAQSWSLEKIKDIGKSSGTTINDVVLTMAGSALRRYLEELGALPDAPLIAMTPVSLRRSDDEFGGNAVGVILCNLATDLPDPAQRLEAVHQSMEDGKRSLRSMSSTQITLASAVAMAPMLLSLLPGARRWAAPAYNVVISNIPGPDRPLYWNGAKLQGVYPLSIPTDGQALNITVTSYNGNMHFGLTGCRRTLPHLQRLLIHLEDSFEELLAVAQA